MNRTKETQIAWQVWNLLNEISDILWDQYGNEFIDFHCEDEVEKYMNELQDESIANTESAVTATQNKEEE
jgi:hypothetical protein